jgi:hypothetical protein
LFSKSHEYSIKLHEACLLKLGNTVSITAKSQDYVLKRDGLWLGTLKTNIKAWYVYLYGMQVAGVTETFVYLCTKLVAHDKVCHREKQTCRRKSPTKYTLSHAGNLRAPDGSDCRRLFMKQSRVTYVSVGTSALYFADNIYQALS